MGHSLQKAGDAMAGARAGVSVRVCVGVRAGARENQKVEGEMRRRTSIAIVGDVWSFVILVFCMRSKSFGRRGFSGSLSRTSIYPFLCLCSDLEYYGMVSQNIRQKARRQGWPADQEPLLGLESMDDTNA